MKTVTHSPVIGTADGVQLLGRAGAPALAGTPITAVHADGADIWVLAEGRDIHRIAGTATTSVTALPDGTRGRCVAVHRGSVWVGGDLARLWRVDGSHLEEVTSFQQAPTQPEWHTPWGGPPDVFSMASDGTHLYVSVHVGGILRSADGTTWTPTIDLHTDVHQVTVGADGRVWAATGMRGLGESDDRGATWRFHTDGLHGTYLLAVAAVDGGAIVGASSGHAGRDGALYRLDGDRFVRCRGLPDDFQGAVGPRQIAADGEHAVVALPGGDIYASHDGGFEWTPLAPGLTDVSEVALVAS
jgi:hypothetical protein